MIRTPITVAVAAVAAVGALAACGPVQMGAAAIAGGQRISTTSLSREVASLRSAYQSNKGKISLQFPASQMPQQVLGWMIRFQVRDRLAQREGITVTRRESQQALGAARQQAKQSGPNVTLADLAVANGLPPDMLPQLGRYQAVENQVVNKIDGGTMPTSTSALQALGKKFNTKQCLAAKSLMIKVNPQFGAVDYSQLSIVGAPSTLSSPASPSPSPSASAQRTPPC